MSLTTYKFIEFIFNKLGRAPVAQSVVTQAVNPGICEFESQLGKHSFRRLTKITDKCLSFFTNGLLVYVKYYLYIDFHSS